MQRRRRANSAKWVDISKAAYLAGVYRPLVREGTSGIHGPKSCHIAESEELLNCSRACARETRLTLSVKKSKI